MRIWLGECGQKQAWVQSGRPQSSPHLSPFCGKKYVRTDEWIDVWSVLDYKTRTDYAVQTYAGDLRVVLKMHFSLLWA